MMSYCNNSHAKLVYGVVGGGKSMMISNHVSYDQKTKYRITI